MYRMNITPTSKYMAPGAQSRLPKAVSNPSTWKLPVQKQSYFKQALMQTYNSNGDQPPESYVDMLNCTVYNSAAT